MRIWSSDINSDRGMARARERTWFTPLPVSLSRKGALAATGFHPKAPIGDLEGWRSSMRGDPPIMAMYSSGCPHIFGIGKLKSMGKWCRI
jgi:hypothetical protein